MSSQHGRLPERAPEPFHFQLEPRRETLIAAAHGDIDVESVGQFRAQLHELLDAGFERVALDLRHVSFIDSSGLRAVFEIAAASRSAGIEFAMLQGSEPVQRLFAVTQTEEAFRFIDPVELERPWT